MKIAIGNQNYIQKAGNTVNSGTSGKNDRGNDAAVIASPGNRRYSCRI
jgi:hypothetical protein